MLAALLLLAAGQWAPAGLEGPIFSVPSLMARPGPTLAFFEFAPTSGAGMPSACSTTAPTGAKGETLTFTRTGNATCSKKGLATTGIADGDLVVMSGNVARVEPDADGVLGLRVEGSRTNSAVRSQEFSNASWTKLTAVIAAPVVTPSDGGAIYTAPDNTPTAERIQFAACPSAGNQSVVYQLPASVSSGAFSASVYLKSNTDSTQSVSVCEFRSTSGAGSCTAYTLQPDSWTRATAPAATASGASGLVFGCNRGSAYAGASNTGAADVLAWGAMVEAGAYATSYIPTVAAAVTRNAEAASFTLPSAIGPSFSLGVSMWWPSSSVGAVTALQLGTGAPDLARIGRNTNTAATFLVNATTTNPAVSAMGTTQQRGTLDDAAGTRTATWQGASVAAPASSMTGTTTALSIGALDGIVTKVCADPVAGRCTP